MHSQVPGLSHQIPGSGVQHQVQVRACFDVSPLHFCMRPRRICTFAHYALHPYPNQKTRTCYPISRDLRPEAVLRRSKGS